jgi:predicted transcriptional regulator of viral defense system
MFLSGRKGVLMIKNDKIREVADRKYGVIKTSDLSALKIDYYGIRKLIENGTLEKIKNGYYSYTEQWTDRSEVALVSYLFPDGILCMYTALFYYGYSDRTPLQWDIAINKDTSKSRFNLDYPYVQPYYLEASQLSFGIATADFDDCKMKIFDRDRLICDCLKFESKMDREIFTKAIQAYVNDNAKNIQNLLTYAKQRRVFKKVKDIIGVWI